MWQVSPLNSANNVNGIGNVPRTEVLTMQHADLVAVEDAMVRKIVAELNGFDNVYYEICNEPYFGGVTLDWQRHVAEVIRATEEHLPKRHLISQNIANGSTRVEAPDSNVSIFNFHYSRPPESVGMNYALNRVIGNNETGFDGQSDATYRIQGWDFLMAGGALFNNLDYSFTVGHEDGSFRFTSTTPGGGSAALRKQLGILKIFLDSLDLKRMKPLDSAAKFVTAEPASVRMLAIPGEGYALCITRALTGKRNRSTWSSPPRANGTYPWIFRPATMSSFGSIRRREKSKISIGSGMRAERGSSYRPRTRKMSSYECIESISRLRFHMRIL